MDQTITVPGWVWLLMIATAFILVAYLMVRTIGWRDLFLFGDERGGNEWFRLMCFGMVIGVPIVCIEATISHLWV